MTKITEIKTKKPNDEIVELLESLLKDAKAGDIQGIAIAGITGDSMSFNTFGPGYYAMALFAEIHVMARDLMDCCIEIRKPPR